MLKQRLLTVGKPAEKGQDIEDLCHVYVLPEALALSMLSLEVNAEQSRPSLAECSCNRSVSGKILGEDQHIENDTSHDQFPICLCGSFMDPLISHSHHVLIPEHVHSLVT